MNYLDKLLSASMIGNALFATYIAFKSPDVLMAICAYLAWAPVFLATRIIDGWWLYVYTKADKKKYMRDMLLWPITLTDFFIFRYQFGKATKILDRAKQTEKGNRVLDRYEYEYVQMIKSKYKDYLKANSRMEDR